MVLHCIHRLHHQHQKEDVQTKSQYGGKDIEVEFYLTINDWIILLEREIAKASRLYQLPIETLSSPYHLHVYSQGEGTDLTGSWYGLGTDLVINQQIGRGFPSSELSF